MNRPSVPRIALVAAGGLMLARGAWVALDTIPAVDRVHVVIWFGLGVALHDGVIAPTSVLLGRFALPVLPTPARWAARAVLVWVATVLVVGLPLVWGARHRANPTVVPGRPLLAVSICIGLGVAAAVVLQRVMARRRPDPPAIDAAAGDAAQDSSRSAQPQEHPSAGAPLLGGE